MKRIRAFTMIEILIITIVISIGLLSIVFAVSKAKMMTNGISQDIIANQLAKEGVEMVYQMRNTNLLQNNTQKELCRLNIDPYTSCDGNQERMSTGSYILTSGNILSGVNLKLDLSGGVQGNVMFAICLNEGKRYPCPEEDNQTKHGKFFRTIEGKGLFDKSNSTTGGIELNCTNGNQEGCSGNIAKEYRFCSRVEYIGTNLKKAEICSIITNFFD